jgi:flagellin
MTRINTNVSSLIAQNALARTNTQLQEALTRLSTGLRINVGKDDPAGLIASEVLRSDIVSTQKAVSNSQRANQMIATADSSLGQVSAMLNDIRGLITEAANTGAMSDEQIAANQLQIDSSLEAINRIAQTTTFQGRKLLDGSLAFVTAAGAGMDTVSDLNIEQANLGATGSMAVNVDVTAAASQASLTATVGAGAAAASAQVNFADGDYITVTAAATGTAWNNVGVNVVETGSVPVGSPFAVYDSVSKQINVYVNNAADTTMANINTAINGLADFNSVYTQNGALNANYSPGAEAPAVATTSGGTEAAGGLAAALVFQLSGQTGSQVFNFDAGTTGTDIKNAVNLVSDATGVTADYVGSTLTFTSTGYGSKALVAVDVISEGGGGGFASSLSGTRDTGTDIAATVNGFGATGDGNTLTVNTATLSMSATVDDGSSTDFSFNITGGGAMFQLGPDVVSNQQARIGIQSMNTGKLGGPSGRLYEVGSGNAAALDTDTTTAAAIVDQVVSKVTSLRGRLGAFQKTTLDTNINALNDTVENLTDAESSIRDADFAAETAKLTRAQILVQSGMSVLAIANQRPQAVLNLLR